MIEEAFMVLRSFLEKTKQVGILADYTFKYSLGNIAEDSPSADNRKLLNDLIVELRNMQENYSGTDKSNSSRIVTKTPFNKSSLVQIKADKNELNNRIDAFVRRKRKEVDDTNVQEFCSRAPVDDDDPALENIESCARVDAVFVPRSGSKSHVKVSQVVNKFGPQTYFASRLKTSSQDTKPQCKTEPLPFAVEERLRNMESHLKLQSGSSVPQNIYKRLKMLEDRILYLEGISPGYLHDMVTDLSHTAKGNLEEARYPDLDIADINSRIQMLQEALTQKGKT